MASVSEEVVIAAPLAEVWPLLSDPAVVASCIPGAALTPEQGDGAWRGTIRVKFGPTVAVFRGEATLAYDHGAHRCTIEGRGIDQRGASRARAQGVVAASGDATTRLKVDGSFTVTGPLETFANAGGVHVARALLAEFAQNMARVAGERGAAAPSEPSAITLSSWPGLSRPSTNSGRGTEHVDARDKHGHDDRGSDAARASPRPTQGELRLGVLLWRIFVDWLRRRFRRERKEG